LRLPRDLHDDLIEAAALEDVSLNQFICAELARAMGRRGAAPDRDRGTRVADADDAGDAGEDPRWKAWDLFR
jgi:hypothetical protein